MGLTITQALVQAMQGSLQIESVEGAGTTARLLLPVAAELGVVPEPVLPQVPDAAPHAGQTAWNVLCVEDNEVNALVFCEALRLLRPKWHCTVASSIKQAQELAANGPWQLAFLDLNLPDGFGLELVGPLATAAIPAERAVLLTADATEATREATLRHGLRAILVKPFHLNELEQLIQQAEQALA